MTRHALFTHQGPQAAAAAAAADFVKVQQQQWQGKAWSERKEDWKASQTVTEMASFVRLKGRTGKVAGVHQQAERQGWQGCRGSSAG